MPHVGIQGLTSRYGQYDSPQCHEGHAPVRTQETYCIDGVECQQNLRAMSDGEGAKHGQTKKPENHDWPKEYANGTCAMLLDKK